MGVERGRNSDWAWSLPAGGGLKAESIKGKTCGRARRQARSQTTYVVRKQQLLLQQHVVHLGVSAGQLGSVCGLPCGAQPHSLVAVSEFCFCFFPFCNLTSLPLPPLWEPGLLCVWFFFVFSMGQEQRHFWMVHWCLCFLGSIPSAAGNHYRYLWKNCYPCYLGHMGYGVGHAEVRPGMQSCYLHHYREALSWSTAEQ